MRRVLVGLVVVLMLNGCAAMIQKRGQGTTYSNLSHKKAALTAVRSLRACGYSLRSASTPVEGMTVIHAVEPWNVFNPNQTIELTITVIDAGQGSVTVDTYSTISNALAEGGVLTWALRRFYSDFERRMMEP